MRVFFTTTLRRSKASSGPILGPSPGFRIQLRYLVEFSLSVRNNRNWPSCGSCNTHR